MRRGALAEQAEAQQALAETRQKVLETLGEDAIDAEGNLAEQFHATKVGREYLEARQKAAHAQPAEALEAAIYNHLYAFFSRYYQDGDFISKRRYSKKERYAIPYNGEEVYLYWANRDQYYVKTAEHFTDYTWKAPNGVSVHFKLQAADVEVNNVKGDKRFFLPMLDDIAWDADNRTLTIPFNYRPLTRQEEIAYGSRNQQESILQKALESIPARLKDNAEALAALTTERRKDAQGNPVSYLEHHLRQYTARNTRDFFIHKDLKDFLSGQLDFYMKNEVLNLDELEAAGEDMAKGWFQLMRLIKRIGNHIIDFLAQIEDFQKALWEKKKFVTETFWCITVGHIPEDFYPEIAANEAQWQEWRELFHIHALPRDMFSGDLNTKKGRIAFLKAQPSLVLDTRHFSQGFTDRLLARFDNLNEMTDGLLVHSENWQALNLLLEKYRARMKTVYIDPPYNTGNDEFLYRDSYRHSSWLSMMYDRLALGRELMREDGVIFVSIDDNEQARLDALASNLFGRANKLATAIWHNSSRSSGKQISTVHEYILAWSRNSTGLPEWKVPREDVESVVGKVRSLWEQGKKEEAFKTLNSFIEAKIHENKERYQYLRNYANIDGKGRIYYAVDLSGDGPGEPRYFKDKGVWLEPPPGRHWMSQEYIDQLYEQQRIIWRGERPYRVVYLHEALENPQGIIRIPTRSGRHELRYLFKTERFDKPKPTALLVRLLKISMTDTGTILDYFAGSGTTGHAVINRNREDGGKRKFVLVEMGEYFDTV
ncbi:site-specific DNA-methyltransferase, partial [Candidatus Parcubacteria bacterium]